MNKNCKMIMIMLIGFAGSVWAKNVSFNVDYETFLSQHDMIWDRIPNGWATAPFTGNGNIGFLFYQSNQELKNVISIYAGRHDYYDHRLPYEGRDMSWIYLSRLPLGHFNLESNGDIQSVNLRLSLWNAELNGVVNTSKGSYKIHGFTHSCHDIIFFETDAMGSESIKITWHPDDPKAPVKQTFEKGGGPKGGSWDQMRNAPYPMPPVATLSEENGMHFCFQPLYDNRGETTTAWEIKGDTAGKQYLMASIHHSFPEHNSVEKAKENLLLARSLYANHTFIKTHRNWWHDYYPLSFLTINDPEKEAFYWIQIYKFASATRRDGPIMDLMGPWYNHTFWPMVWGDLNVQLQYWTHLTANRLAVGESLANTIDKYAKNLSRNVPASWKDSAAIAACFPQDLNAYNHGKVPDMLAWILHNYWLHCEYAGDRERMRDKLFPVMKKNVNAYLNYIRENPVESDDGKIHIKKSWSPEYPGGHGQDMNFTLALLRWSCQTLVNINNEHKINDPLLLEWQNILDNLVDYQIDENGLRVGKDVPFDKPHRHYSHLLGFYPLAVITPENETNKKMLRTSVNHWLDVTINQQDKAIDNAKPVCGYTATGAASMYAYLCDADEAYRYLDFFMKSEGLGANTMMGEPYMTLETPLSCVSSIHDMLLQSWGGKIRVFPATPKKWTDAAFKNLRGQGAFLVSAKKKDGATQFVRVESLMGTTPCIIQTDIVVPKIYINSKLATECHVNGNAEGFYDIKLSKGDTVTFVPVDLDKADLSITPVSVSESNTHLFGLNEKTTRLPGHHFYFKETQRSISRGH